MTVFEENLWLSLPVPGFVMDAENRIAEVNPAAENFLNASVRQLRGTPVFDAVAIDAPLDDQIDRVRTDQASLFLHNVDVGGGNAVPVNCNIQIAPMAHMAGYVLMLVEPRMLAEKLGRSLSAKSAAKSAIGMAEMLAHEIKNPLAGIIGAAQFLSMNLTAKDQEMTDLIVNESRRIVALLEQVEQFGNIRSPERKAVNIHDLLDRARKSAAVGFAAHMQIVEDYDPSLPPTWVDGDQMLQVFLNLIKNAAEASKGANGSIKLRTFYDMSIRLRRKGGSAFMPLNVEVIDDGPGLPEDITDEAFEPFVSGRENGTGLGLALVSKIISDHDGWISVDSVPGRTVFRISLPMVPQSALAENGG